MYDDHQVNLIERARRQFLAVRDGPSDPVPSLRLRGDASLLPADALPNYRILKEIHRGGQGVVYRAIQQGTQQEVAIKVMRAGAFAGAGDRLRFEREVRVLGGLRHPNIVTIHDSGTAGGVAYFVMDYVAGRSLGEFVAQTRPSVPEILRFFVKICDAVNAAHVRGIIHRDLKSGNIRVDANGEPRVLDFGLAKLLEPAAADSWSGDGRLSSSPNDTGDGPRHAATETGQFVGSLPWSSPEQAEGRHDQVDLRSDVYSLGVMLHQLLTNRFPYSVGGSIRELMERIASAIPSRPSGLRRGIDEDVDTIVLKCLSKEPERRYQSAGELARDIRRHLAGEPIDARRDSAAYVLRKTLRRYRVPVALASATMLVVISLAAGLAVMNHRQSVLRADAERHADDARAKMRLAQETSEFILDQMADRLGSVLGASDVRRDLLQKAYDHLSRLAEKDPDDPLLRIDMVKAHCKLGELKRKLGERDAALEHYGRAQTLLDGLLTTRPDDRECLELLADLELARGDLSPSGDEARGHYRRQLEIAERLSAMRPDDAAGFRRISFGYERMAVRSQLEGKFDDALAWTRKMYELKQRMVDSNPAGALYLYELSVALERLANLAQHEGDSDGQERYANRALEIRERLTPMEPRNPVYLRALSMSYEQQAVLAAGRNDTPSHRAWAEKMFALKQTLVELEPRHPLYQHDLAICYNRLGVLDLQEHHAEQAAECHRKALTIYRRLDDAEPNSERYRDDLAKCLQHLADAAIATGALPAATACLTEAVVMRRMLVESSSNKGPHRRDLDRLFDRLAHVADRHLELGEDETAGRVLRESMAMLVSEDIRHRQIFQKLLDRSVQVKSNKAPTTSEADAASIRP